MSSWRTLICIATITLLFIFFASDFSLVDNFRSTSRLIQKVHHQGSSSSSFDARPFFTKDRSQYDSDLHKRDVCNDAFPGRVTQTCSPSQTLCCIIPGEKLPTCTTILGYGFCCTEHTDCFVDVESTCNTTDSSTCAAGLCCPAQTNCVDNFQYSNSSLVRCNVIRDLIPANIVSLASTSSTVTSTSTSTTTSSAMSSKTASATVPVVSAAQTSTTSHGDGTNDGGSQTHSLSSGAIAGIAIGSVAGVAILALLGWLVWRHRSKNNATAAPAVSSPSYNPVSQELPGGSQEMSNAHQVYEAPGTEGYYEQHPAQKITYANAGVPSHELGNEGQRHELP